MKGVDKRYRSCVAAIAFAGVALTGGLPAAAAQLAVGQPAPAFALRTLQGRTLTNASFRGKVVVINVWGSWCPPCRLETPDLIAESAAQRGAVAFVGVDTTETPAVVRAFAAARGLNYPQVVTTAASPFAQDYRIVNFPTTFVIDAHGVLRAAHADNVLPRQQLQAYISAAQRGATAPLRSDEQRKLDRLLDPSRYLLGGSPAEIVASSYAAVAAIDAADREMDDAMSDPKRDHDLIATRAREASLRDAAIAALAPIARTQRERATLDRLRGDRAAVRENWTAAEGAYAAALAIAPDDTQTLAAAAYVAGQRGDNGRAALLDERLATLAPSYANEIDVVSSQAGLGHRVAAFAALDRAIALARKDGSPAHLAWTYLHGGRAAVQLHDTQRARLEFAAAASAAANISRTNPRYRMYLEQAQEATVALSLANAATIGVSLTPWTGPELPGSIPSTSKYRLVVTGRPAATLDLAARGLPKGWIGSFCSDRLCAPFTTTIVVPPAGVKIVEFQVIPGGLVVARPTIKIEVASGGKIVAAATASITR